MTGIEKNAVTGNLVEARGLSLSFGSTPALRGPSLAVLRGEVVAVMGPSGSGMSTLLHCLAGILVPGEGEVWFGGQRLDSLSDDRRSALRRGRFGFVFQSGQLVPELTAEANVALPLLLSGTRHGPAMAAARRWFPVPVLAAIAARLALRPVNISPLGVARRVTPQPPRAWRVIPLLAGLAELGFWTIDGHPASGIGQIQAFASSFFFFFFFIIIIIILVGLFIAGPWLTMAAAVAMARWTSRPATLLAARRIGDDPGAAFRAVSGLVLALFITTATVVAITTQDAKETTPFGTVAQSNLMTDQVAAPSPPGSRVTDPGPAAPAAALAARLEAIHGIHGVVVLSGRTRR